MSRKLVQIHMDKMTDLDCWLNFKGLAFDCWMGKDFVPHKLIKLGLLDGSRYKTIYNYFVLCLLVFNRVIFIEVRLGKVKDEKKQSTSKRDLPEGH